MTAILLLIVAVFLFLLSLCAIVPPQTYTMWKLQIVATEWGHLIAIVALILLIVSLAGKHKAAAAISVLALLCGISSSVMAAVWSRGVERKLIETFGDANPRVMAGATMRTKPFRPTRLFTSPPAPQVHVVTESFAQRDLGSLDLD